MSEQQQEPQSFIFTPDDPNPELPRSPRQVIRDKGFSLTEYYELIMTRGGEISILEALPGRVPSSKWQFGGWKREDLERFARAEQLWSSLKQDPKLGHQ